MTAAELREQVEGRQWYHTLELAPGLRTPGWFDLREIAAEILPPSLAGPPLPRRRHLRRLLGVRDGAPRRRRGGRDRHPRSARSGTGRRTRRPEVIAALAERKRGGGRFRARPRGARLRRRAPRAQRLRPRPGGVVGEFDFVYVGSLLLHLRDPVRALAAVRSVCAGEAVIVDAIDLPRTLLHRRRPVATLDGRGRPWWWKPNLAALARLAEAAGFELARPAAPALHAARRGPPAAPALAAAAAARPRGREELLNSWRGDPARGDRRPPRRGMSPRLSVVLSTLGNHAGLARVLDGYGSPGGGARELRAAGGRRPGRTRPRGGRGGDRRARRTRCGCCAAGSRALGKPQRRLARGRGAAGPVHRQRHDPRPAAGRRAPRVARARARLRGGGARPRALGARGPRDAVHALARPRDAVRLPRDRRPGGRLGSLLRRERVDQARARRAGRRLRRGAAALRLRGPRLRLPRERARACACSTTADAVVEHLRAYDLPFYKRRVRRLAHAEHRFVAKHPELEPWFFRMFSHAARLRAGLRPRPPPDPHRQPLDPAGRRARLAQRRPLLPSGAGARLPRRLGGGRGRGARLAARLPAGRSSRSAAPERPTATTYARQVARDDRRSRRPPSARPPRP